MPAWTFALAPAAVYLLPDGAIAIANRSGWFTDRSEFAKAGLAGHPARPALPSPSTRLA